MSHVLIYIFLFDTCSMHQRDNPMVPVNQVRTYIYLSVCESHRVCVHTAENFTLKQPFLGIDFTICVFTISLVRISQIGPNRKKTKF